MAFGIASVWRGPGAKKGSPAVSKPSFLGVCVCVSGFGLPKMMLFLLVLLLFTHSKSSKDVPIERNFTK